MMRPLLATVGVSALIALLLAGTAEAQRHRPGDGVVFVDEAPLQLERTADVLVFNGGRKTSEVTFVVNGPSLDQLLSVDPPSVSIRAGAMAEVQLSSQSDAAARGELVALGSDGSLARRRVAIGARSIHDGPLRLSEWVTAPSPLGGSTTRVRSDQVSMAVADTLGAVSDGKGRRGVVVVGPEGVVISGLANAGEYRGTVAGEPGSAVERLSLIVLIRDHPAWLLAALGLGLLAAVALGVRRRTNADRTLDPLFERARQICASTRSEIEAALPRARLPLRRFSDYEEARVARYIVTASVQRVGRHGADIDIELLERCVLAYSRFANDVVLVCHQLARIYGHEASSTTFAAVDVLAKTLEADRLADALAQLERTRELVDGVEVLNQWFKDLIAVHPGPQTGALNDERSDMFVSVRSRQTLQQWREQIEPRIAATFPADLGAVIDAGDWEPTRVPTFTRSELSQWKRRRIVSAVQWTIISLAIVAVGFLLFWELDSTWGSRLDYVLAFAWGFGLRWTVDTMLLNRTFVLPSTTLLAAWGLTEAPHRVTQRAVTSPESPGNGGVTRLDQPSGAPAARRSAP